MLNIFDASEWFLQKQPVSHKKLQKLCYYAQAWSYALKGSPLLCDEKCNGVKFQAWVHGPVSPLLYKKYSDYGWNNIPVENRVLNIEKDDLELLESVWYTYGDSSGNALEALSHTEPPWINARVGVKDEEGSNNVITVKDMKKYYRSIYLDN